MTTDTAPRPNQEAGQEPGQGPQQEPSSAALPLGERRVALGVSLALALGQWGSAFRTGLRTGFGDWQMVHHNWEAAWVTVTRHGEMPLWDPYHCGGIPLFGNPESPPNCRRVDIASRRPVRILWPYVWWPTSQTMRSSGVLKA